MSFLDRTKRQALLLGGPMAARKLPVPLPESLPWPEFVCSAMPGPKPRDWHHYIHARDGVYSHVGRCAGRDHGGGEPHDHCEHQWDDAAERGHRCELPYAHDGEHVCGCCNATSYRN